ncbi:hypothetical protein Goarm_012926 [Gossypium armourianum]|uniref:H(+)-transporting two-sector ATPase n=1 Tax=Gossypium armourianum TaxID=34283 RepID=A0A7J9J1F7_9ROSI|nr:hypothetical protein [Gossypium armourianum]
MDDLTDPAPAKTFVHLNATTVLSKGLAAKGLYPAVDPLDSTSTMLQPRIIGEEQYETTQMVKQTLQCYKELQDIIAIFGLDELSEEDRLTVARAYRYFENTPLRPMVNDGSDGGFARIGNNKITILVNDVEKGSDVDPQGKRT